MALKVHWRLPRDKRFSNFRFLGKSKKNAVIIDGRRSR